MQDRSEEVPAAVWRGVAKDYEILEALHEGGMGIVYKVRHRKLMDIRVIKVLKPDLAGSEAAQRRFRREAQAAVRLKHPNICTVYNFWTDPVTGLGYLEMEYLDGLTLQGLLQNQGRLDADFVLEIAKQALQAIGYMHRQEYVHCDISTDNFVLIRWDGRLQLKLIDLGVAQGRSIEKTTNSLFMGKPPYASPEHFGGTRRVDARSDLYSLGIVLYELATGRLPLSGEDLASFYRAHLHQPPLPFAESDPQQQVPSALRSLILDMLAKDPVSRPPAETVLKRVQDLQGLHPLRPEPWDRLLDQKRRNARSSVPERETTQPEKLPAHVAPTLASVPVLPTTVRLNADDPTLITAEAVPTAPLTASQETVRIDIQQTLDKIALRERELRERESLSIEQEPPGASAPSPPLNPEEPADRSSTPAPKDSETSPSPDRPDQTSSGPPKKTRPKENATKSESRDVARNQTVRVRSWVVRWRKIRATLEDKTTPWIVRVGEMSDLAGETFSEWTLSLGTLDSRRQIRIAAAMAAGGVLTIFLLALVFSSLRTPTPNPSPPPPVVVSEPEPVPEPPPDNQERLQEIDQLLAEKKLEDASNALEALRADGIEEQTYQQLLERIQDLQEELDSSLALAEHESSLREILIMGLKNGDVRSLVKVVDDIDLLRGEQPQSLADLETELSEARKWKNLYHRMWGAKDQDPFLLLQHSTALLRHVPTYQSASRLQRKAAEDIEAKVVAEIETGNPDIAQELLTKLRIQLPERRSAELLVTRIKARQDHIRQQNSRLEAAEQAGRERRPLDGLRILHEFDPDPKLALRAQRLEKELNQTWERIDRQSPVVSLDTITYSRNKDAVVVVRVTDDYQVDQVIAWVAVDEDYEKYALSSLADDRYQLKIPKNRHKNKKRIRFFVVARDFSNHTGSLGSQGNPEVIKRKGLL